MNYKSSVSSYNISFKTFVKSFFSFTCSHSPFNHHFPFFCYCSGIEVDISISLLSSYSTIHLLFISLSTITSFFFLIICKLPDLPLAHALSLHLQKFLIQISIKLVRWNLIWQTLSFDTSPFGLITVLPLLPWLYNCCYFKWPNFSPTNSQKTDNSDSWQLSLQFLIYYTEFNIPIFHL